MSNDIVISCVIHLLAWLMSGIKKPYIVGITGGSGSGKTRFIRELGQLFKEEEICIVSQDNYYKTMEHHTRDALGHINYDLPQCIDMESFFNDIQTLQSGQIVRRREYRFQHEEQHGSWFEMKPAKIILVEGLFIFFDAMIYNLFDLKIFIDADESIQLERRLKRDTIERNITPEFVIYQWENHVKPAYINYLLPFKDKADMIILNNTHFAQSMQVIEDHFKVILSFKS